MFSVVIGCEESGTERGELEISCLLLSFVYFLSFFLDRINVEQILRDSCFVYDIKIGFYLPRIIGHQTAYIS